MRRLLLAFLLFLFAVPAFTQAKHPFTFEDMMKLKRVGEPEVSPDGKWVHLQRGRCRSRSELRRRRTSGSCPSTRPPGREAQEREIIADQDGGPPALGAGWEDGLHFCRRKKADRRSGSRISTAPQGR